MTTFFASLAWWAVVLPALVRADEPGEDSLAVRLAAAKRGEVVTLEAKTYQAGNLVVPAGVTLRGAGFAQTILDATGCKNGVSITAGEHAAISDLTVRNASENGILVSGASDVTLSRLKVISNLTGLSMEKTKDSRIENVVVAKNRTGATLSGDVHTALVNCTLADNSAIGLALSHNQNVAVFNDIIVNSPTALYLTEDNAGLLLDHNLYFANFVGKMEGETVRASLPGWRRLTAMDAHSVSLPVDFVDAAHEDYRPASTLGWAPNLVTTAGWGAPKLADFAAPATDILGAQRGASADLGAYLVQLPAPRPPDGRLTISSDDGVKSAGLYNEKGVQVSVLFQNLPLARGNHDFWVPARDSWNRPLRAGKYEVRLVESQLNNPYLGLAGNFNPTSKLVDGCSWSEEQFAFDAQDRLYVLQNAFENGIGIRAYDCDYRNLRWMMPGGAGNIGAATDGTWLYYLQWNFQPKNYTLRKINLETGHIEPIAPGHLNLVIREPFSDKAYGMAVLNGRIYVSDPVQGKVFWADSTDPKFTQSFDVPGALSVTADQKNNLLWVIDADGKLLGLDPASGAVKETATPSPGIKRISANNSRLATLSTKTGKIEIFDISDPAHFRSLRTIGTGDGPAGPQQPDRFWFEDPPMAGTKFQVALNSKGAVAVVDGKRISFWGADGSLKKQGLGFWGQHNYLGRFAGSDDVRIFGMDSPYCIKMDSEKKRWLPDGAWNMPDFDYVYLEGDRSMRNVFTAGGKNFGVYEISVGDPGKTDDHKLQTAVPIDPRVRVRGLLVVRFDEREAVPVSLYYPDSVHNTLMEVHDSNGDGKIDGADDAKEIRKADGSAVGIFGDRYGGLPWDASGDMVYAGSGEMVKMTGLDSTGTWPVYDWAAPVSIPCTFEGTSAQMISPYDYKTVENLNSTVQLARLSDGGYASAIGLKSSGGTGLGNGCGTDIAGFGKDGVFRWLYRCNTVEGCEGVQSLPTFNLVMGMTTKECDYMVMDGDGLGLGVLSMPKEAHWQGMWSDHAQQQQVWVGNDGKPYYILGDYAANGFHWFAITGTERTIRKRVPVEISDPEAAALAAEADLKPVVAPKPTGTKVLIRRLAQPFAIDGAMKKWRDAGITPIAVVTPETGSADITGPQDCSAVIRVAYQGKDLYVQTIVFRQMTTFFQPHDGQLNQQDGIEMAINGFMQGFKYNVTVSSDRGPVIYRNRFVVASMDRFYTPEQAPRSIKVLDNARDVEERHLIEAVYGVDLSNSKVIVTEFKLPLTPEVAFDGDPGLVTVAPGKTFWLGFFINANDVPGGDIQKYLLWPATYGNFNVKEAGALATFE